MIKIMVTGFEPSWGIKKTPSGEFVKLWETNHLKFEGGEIIPVILPQLFGVSTKMLWSKITEHAPNIVLMFGATPRNDPFRIEKFALNIENSIMGDNNRIRVDDRKISLEGPSAYETNLPTNDILKGLLNDNLNAKVSYFCGTHVCNSLMYGILHKLNEQGLLGKIWAGFFHFPFPNEFGVIEDELWNTGTFPGIIKTSLEMMRIVSNLYKERVLCQSKIYMP